ncbi:MAG: TonB-dependent receptor [Myxococcota bacterium]
MQFQSTAPSRERTPLLGRRDPLPRVAWLSSLCALRDAVVVGSALLFAALPASAQSSDAASGQSAASDPFAGVEEMVVVGSGQTEALTTSSTSVTSFDAMKLESLGVSNVSDVAAYTPNLEIRSASATTATFFIRGVGLNDFTANASSAVAVYVDDAPRNLPAIQLGLLYDMQNIEIQKGPQGSGPGRNASAGAIRMYTKKPTGEYDAFLNVDYGNYNLVDIEGGLEVPIIEDMLAMRTAFKMRTRDGIVTNRCGGKSLAEVSVVGQSICGEVPRSNLSTPPQIRPNLEKDLNNTDAWSARTSFRFLPPVDDMEWNVVGHIDRVDQLGIVGQHLGTNQPSLGGGDVNSYQAREVSRELDQIRAGLNIPTVGDCRLLPRPARDQCLANRQTLLNQADKKLGKNLANRPLDKLPFTGDYNTPGYERQTTGGFTLQGEWQIGDILLKNITGFERYDRERLIDADYSPNTLFEFHIDDDAWQVTEDLRLGSELDVLPISWNAGAFYLQEELDYLQETIAARGFIDPVRQEYVQKTKSFGVFFDFSWALLDDLTLDAGVRYNWEQKRFEAQIFRGAGLTPACGTFDPQLNAFPPCQRMETVDHPTGTVALTYDFDELREVFFKYSHGWKGLQYNARDGSVASEVTDVANPEVIDAFELGGKGSWLDDRITVDGALFWYAYQNYQVFTFTNNPRSAPVRVVINADNALNFGAELATTIKPIEGLTADVRFGWLETKFLDFTSSAARAVPGSTEFFRLVFDYNKNQLPNAPRFKASGGIEYAIDLNRYGRITPRYDVNWTDDVNFDPSNGLGAPDASGNQTKPDHTIGQKAFFMHNLSLRYVTPSEQLEVAVWARNLTNEVYKTLAFDASGGPGFVGNLVGDPRTYGLTFKISY